MNCAKALSAQLLALPLAILCGALIHASAVFGAEPKTPQKFALTSTAFQAGADVPRKYTCDGEDVSPPLRWQNAPAGTQAFALIVDDPDAPGGPWVHWVMYDLPATTTELAEASVKTDTIFATSATADRVRRRGRRTATISSFTRSTPQPISSRGRRSSKSSTRSRATCSAKPS